MKELMHLSFFNVRGHLSSNPLLSHFSPSLYSIEKLNGWFLYEMLHCAQIGEQTEGILFDFLF